MFPHATAPRVALGALAVLMSTASAFDINGKCDCKLNTFDCGSDNNVYHCAGPPGPDGHWDPEPHETCPGDATCKLYYWEYGNYYDAGDKPTQQNARCIPNSLPWQPPAEVCDPATT